MNVSTKTYERLAAMRHAEQAAKDLAAKVEAEATPPESRDEQIARVAAERVAAAKSRLATATPGEREQLKRRIALHGQVEKSAEARQAEAKRSEAYRNHASYKLAAEHYEGFSRSGKVNTPGVTDEDIATCGAILNTEFPDPESAAKAYWSKVTEVEDRAYQLASKSAADEQHTALKAERDAANAALAAKQREHALATARANMGSSDERA